MKRPVPNGFEKVCRNISYLLYKLHLMVPCENLSDYLFQWKFSHFKFQLHIFRRSTFINEYPFLRNTNHTDVHFTATGVQDCEWRKTYVTSRSIFFSINRAEFLCFGSRVLTPWVLDTPIKTTNLLTVTKLRTKNGQADYLCDRKIKFKVIIY